jgi:AraC family transcriptional regulator, regulatory protein of adaptative response / DNA-3-methyladenine glycosylase II
MAAASLTTRAVIGQQISTAAARTHAARLAARYGGPVTDPDGGLSHVFPSPEALSEVELAMPAGRVATVRALLDALRFGELDLTPGGDRERARAALEALPGIGPWTSEVVAMRALGDPDAFPATDLGIRRSAEALGLPSSGAALFAHAERWRPWRAYAVQHLWGATRHPINQWPPAASADPAAERLAA